MPFNPNIIYHVKYITTDNLVPGDFVVAYNYGAGEIRVKKAVVNPYLLVVGFVRSAYTAGALDPFVTGGFYFALRNNSGANINIESNVGILITTYYQKPTDF
jgi:hypothetical protein